MIEDENDETANVPLVSDLEDNKESVTMADSSATPLSVTIPELTYQSSSGTSSGTQSTDAPILIEDDSDENGETANVPLLSDSDGNEESATVAESSSTSLPVAIPELTHQSSSGILSGTQLNDIRKLISSQLVGEIDVYKSKLKGILCFSTMSNLAVEHYTFSILRWMQ